jgi:hypothetical protein
MQKKDLLIPLSAVRIRVKSKRCVYMKFREISHYKPVRDHSVCTVFHTYRIGTYSYILYKKAWLCYVVFNSQMFNLQLFKTFNYIMVSGLLL